MVYVCAASCDPVWAVDEAAAEEARAVMFTGVVVEFDESVVLDGVEGTLPAAMSSTQNAPDESVEQTASLRGSRTYNASYDPSTTWFFASSSAVQFATNPPSMPRMSESSQEGWEQRFSIAVWTWSEDAV